jgi:hypothetical protein
MPLLSSPLLSSLLRRAVLFAATVGAWATYDALRGQQPDTPAGTWRGTSICTPGHPSCHDETVVYRIRAAGARFEIAASKIVQGQEEFMGNVTCGYTPATHVLNCPSSYGVWNFLMDGQAMTGTLVARGELYRRVAVSRAAS